MGVNRNVRLGQWTRHLFLYGSGVVLLNLLPALLIPIYTYRITPAEYGALELLNRSQEILLLVLSLGLRSTLMTFYQMKKDEPERQMAVYSTALQFLLAFGLVTIGLSLLGAGELSQILFESSSYRAAVVLMLGATYFEMLFQMAVLHLQSELRSSIYVCVFVSRSVLAILLNLIVVYWMRWGLMGILWANLIHTSLFTIGMIAYTLWRTWRPLDAGLLGEMLRFGAPLGVGAIAMFILNNGDRYFLNIYATRADVGIYGLGYRLGTMSVALVLTPFLKIWSATMVDISRQADGPRALGKCATYLLTASMFATLALSLMGPYMVRCLAQRTYEDAYKIVPIIGAAYIFYAWTIIMDASFYLTKHTWHKLYNVVAGCGVILAFYWRLIPPYGMMGAAWATLAGFASFAAVTAILAQRIYWIKYELGRIAILFLVGLAIYGSGTLIPVSPIATGLLGRLAIVLVFPVILWIGGFLTKDERRAVQERWQTFRMGRLGSGVTSLGQQPTISSRIDLDKESFGKAATPDPSQGM